jgi:hypothetical protein
MPGLHQVIWAATAFRWLTPNERRWNRTAWVGRAPLGGAVLTTVALLMRCCGRPGLPVPGVLFRRCLANGIPYSIGIGPGSKPMFSSGFSMRPRRTRTWSTRCLLPISLTPRKKQQKTALQDAFIIIRNQRHQRLITKARDRHSLPILGRQWRVVQHQDCLATQYRAFAR